MSKDRICLFTYLFLTNDSKIDYLVEFSQGSESSVNVYNLIDIYYLIYDLSY